jgi:hypothetical protein
MAALRPLACRIGANFTSWTTVCLLPLVAYAVALLSHLHPYPGSELWCVQAALAGAPRASARAASRLPLWNEPPSSRDVPRTLVFTYHRADAVPAARLELWRQLNPGWEVLVLGDAEAADFLEVEFSVGHRRAFERIPSGPIRSDFFRVHWLLRHGGAYADVDLLPQQPLDRVAAPQLSDPVVPMTIPPFTWCFGIRRPNPALAIAPPGHPFFLALSRAYLELDATDEPFSYEAWSVVALSAAILYRLPLALRPPVTVVERCPLAMQLFGIGLESVLRHCQLERIGDGLVLARARSDDYDMRLHRFRSDAGSDAHAPEKRSVHSMHVASITPRSRALRDAL